jgi:uncharacterized cysteine cluster protein YcgN (CxxCxxCC family)
MPERIVVAKIVKEYTGAEWDALCRRCGYCCRIHKQDKRGIWVDNGPCPHLKYIGNGKTECDIYPNCFGIQLDADNYCEHVESVYERAPDCPYNKIIKEGYVIGREAQP